MTRNTVSLVVSVALSQTFSFAAGKAKTEADAVRETSLERNRSRKEFFKKYKKQRHQSLVWQQAGCILDAHEKVCDDDAPKNSKYAEKLHIRLLEESLNPLSHENMFLCCCPRPYKTCGRNKVDKFCLKEVAAMKKRITGINPDHDDAATEMQKELQKLRGRLMDNAMKGKVNEKDAVFMKDESEKSVVAPMEPFTYCTKEQKLYHTRPDLKCDMLTWQFEELSDGNKPEFKQDECPFVRIHQAKRQKADKRKDHMYNKKNWGPLQQLLENMEAEEPIEPDTEMEKAEL
ncbi:unnamed protein product [Amoebophrya sp. A120]|nr:unnamed protein product [Amoebophrya sp. A120]|eukprot:GSA120T00005650001.1